jgi:hypothetical protein
MLVIRYRPQRGGFDEAMALAEDFPNIEALQDKYPIANIIYGGWDYHPQVNADYFEVTRENDDAIIGFCWFVEVS